MDAGTGAPAILNNVAPGISPKVRNPTRAALDPHAIAALTGTRLFDLSLDLICVVGVDGYFKQLNPAWEQVLGFSRRHLMSRPHAEFVHPDDLDGTASRAAGQAAGDQTVEFENRYRRRDGSYRRLAWTSTLEIGGGLFYAIARDVTEQKAAADQALRSESSLTRLFRTAPEGIIEVDEHGRIAAWNPQAELMFGLTAAEVLGRSLAETVVPRRNRASSRALLRQFYTDPGTARKSITMERVGLRSTGEEFPIELTIAPAGTEAGSPFMGFVRDISDRKRLESLESVRTEVTAVLAAGGTVEDAAPRILEAICTELGWRVGEFWVVGRGGDRLTRIASWHRGSRRFGAFIRATAGLVQRKGEGFAGRVWAQGRPLGLDDLEFDPAFAHMPAARAAGLHAAFGFPISGEAGTHAVLQFLTVEHRRLDTDLLEAMSSIAAQIGIFLERAVVDQRVRAILDNVAEGIVTLDEQGRIESFNGAASRLLGYTEDEVIGTAIGRMISANNRREFKDYLVTRLRPGKQAPASGITETTGRRKDGGLFPMEFVAADMRLAGRRVFIASLSDISERHAYTEALRRQALHDPLTGLPNRILFNDRLSHALTVSRRSKGIGALVMMDMDRFKEVNDTLGHDAGDQLLKGFADRVTSVLRERDTVARLGGDEFAVIVEDLVDEAAAIAVARKVLRAVEKPFMLDATSRHIAISIGIAITPEHGTDAETLMRRADAAMYVAKRSGSGYVVYSPTVTV